MAEDSTTVPRASELLSGYYQQLTEAGVPHETADRIVVDAASALHHGNIALVVTADD